MLSTKRHRRDMGLSGDASQMTGLALFIILLAFFIMLSSISGVFLKNSDAILESVRGAFGVPDIMVLDGSGRSMRPSSISRLGQGTSLQDVAGAFENEVPGIRAVLVRRAGQLQIDIPINEMNRLTGLSGTAGVSPVLQTMVSFLSDPTRTTYHITIQINERPLKENKEFLKQNRKSSIFDPFLLEWASVFLKSGISGDRLNIAVGTGHPGLVTLIIESRGGTNK